jgi:hypothetical protein
MPQSQRAAGSLSAEDLSETARRAARAFALPPSSLSHHDQKMIADRTQQRPTRQSAIDVPQ